MILRVNDMFPRYTMIYFCNTPTIFLPASFNSDLVVEHITEERASRCLARIELLCRIRERVLPHPELENRLAMCQPSSDLPHWWISGKHDRDLLLGVAKYFFDFILLCCNYLTDYDCTTCYTINISF